MPAWVQQPDQEPYRPLIAGWTSTRTKRIYITEPFPPHQEDFEAALNALTDFAHDRQLAGYRPGRIEVKDAALAEYLGERLAEAQVTVQRCDKLFTFERVLTETAQALNEHPLIPNAMDAKGVTLEMMQAFAEAACRFYQSAPWEQLTSEDLVEIEAPFVDAFLRYFSVLGGRDTLGLAFYDSQPQFESFCDGSELDAVQAGKHWAVFFGPITELPFDDADLWLDHNLAVAGRNAYPVAVCIDPLGKSRRPGPQILAFFEGIMRTLAQTTEGEIDSGHWETTLTTSMGQMTLRLSLPELLKQDHEDTKRKIRLRGDINARRSMESVQTDLHRILEAHDFETIEEMQKFIDQNIVGKEVPHMPANSPLEQAQDLVYEAFESRGRRQLQLVRKALEICPDCADAYVVLAERCSHPKKAHDLYAQGVKAGQRALGKRFFQQEAGNFWSILQTRPYMRARLGLAESLQELGHLDEAIAHYRELLRLNPNDNQGVRDLLMRCLLETSADGQAKQLLKQYSRDTSALWSYARALLSFRAKGDTKVAREHVKKALAANRHAARYLSGRQEMPDFPPAEYSPGDESEAIVCAEALGRAWQETPGAVAWLRSRS